MSLEKLRAVYDARVASNAPANRVECPTPEQLEHLADSGNGASGTNLTMLDHVFGCAYCRAEFAILRAVQPETDAVEGSSAARNKTVSRWFSGTRIAIAASLLLALGIGGEALRRMRVGATSDVVRSSQNDSNDIVLVSPLRNAAGAPFVWRKMAGTATYEVQVLDTTGAVLATHLTSDTVYTPSQAERERIESAGTFDWFVAARRSDGNERRSSIARVRVGASVRR